MCLCICQKIWQIRKDYCHENILETLYRHNRNNPGGCVVWPGNVRSLRYIRRSVTHHFPYYANYYPVALDLCYRINGIISLVDSGAEM